MANTPKTAPGTTAPGSAYAELNQHHARIASETAVVAAGKAAVDPAGAAPAAPARAETGPWLAEAAAYRRQQQVRTYGTYQAPGTATAPPGASQSAFVAVTAPAAQTAATPTTAFEKAKARAQDQEQAARHAPAVEPAVDAAKAQQHRFQSRRVVAALAKDDAGDPGFG